MYHADRHAWAIFAVIIAITVGMVVANLATGQPVDFGQLDPEAIGGAIEATGVIKLAPEWLAAIIPTAIIAICSILNAVFKDGQMGKLAPLINKGALAIGKAKTKPELQE